jgi:hypothetical protein
MREVLRTNDPVLLSYARHVLGEAGIEAMVLDEHTAAAEGSIGAIQRRLMVAEDDHARACRVLARCLGEDGGGGL